MINRRNCNVTPSDCSQAGGNATSSAAGTFMTGQIYVERLVPHVVKKEHALVFIHGAAQSGTVSLPQTLATNTSTLADAFTTDAKRRFRIASIASTDFSYVIIVAFSQTCSASFNHSLKKTGLKSVLWNFQIQTRQHSKIWWLRYTLRE